MPSTPRGPLSGRIALLVVRYPDRFLCNSAAESNRATPARTWHKGSGVLSKHPRSAAVPGTHWPECRTWGLSLKLHALNS